MELAQHQMQTALSVVTILGAAVVAFVCDLLKRNNQQLRELTLELKVRREEEEKRSKVQLVPYPPAAPEAGKLPAAASSDVSKNTGANTVTAKVVTPAESGPSRRRERREKRAIAPEALAAIHRGEQLAASPKPRRVLDPMSPDPVVEIAEATPPPVVKASEERKIPKSEVRDWGSVLTAGREAGGGNCKDLAPVLPAGFQDGFVLTRLVESHQPVSGLVVSIGATQDSNGSLPANIPELIQSLIGPNDFAAQSGKNEFLLIYPGERGASAQRRLSQIAEHLWDFQLRSMGALSILFSWGGVEVSSESIDEAIASATERMEETRRNRRVLTMGSRQSTEAPLRRAV